MIHVLEEKIWIGKTLPIGPDSGSMEFSTETIISQSALKVQIFKGTAAQWPAFRDSIEAIAASLDLKDVLTGARPSMKETFERGKG